MPFENNETNELSMPLEKVKGDWRGKTERFWKLLGFAQIETPDKRLVFKAGSIAHSSYSFNSRSIPRTVTVFERDGTVVFQYAPDLRFRGGFQNPSDPDLPYLNWEVDEFGKYLTMPEWEAENYNPVIPATVLRGLCSGLKTVLVKVVPIIVILGIFFCVMVYVKGWPGGGGGMNLDRSVYENREGFADVYLMPFEGFDLSLASGLARELSKDLGLNVKITTHIPLPPDAFNVNRQQYDSNMLAGSVTAASRLLLDAKYNAAFIALFHGSIYSPDAPFRFVFSSHHEGDIAVVGDYEMESGVSENSKNLRLYKMLKRSIGVVYYRYPASTIPESVMKSPIMSTQDLDNIGTKYDTELEKTNAAGDK